MKERLAARRYLERFRFLLFKEEAHMCNIGVDNFKKFVNLTLKLYSDIRELGLDKLNLERLKEEFTNPTPKNINWIMGIIRLRRVY